MAGNLNWFGAEYLASAETEVEKAITRLTITLERNVKQDLRAKSGPTATAPTRDASKAGEVPHLRTGTYHRSIDHETVRRGSDFIGRVGTNMKIGKWLELGTQKTTVIRPTRGKWLSWVDQTGTRRFAKQVTIPPLKARPHLRPALDALKPEIETELKKAGGRFKP